MTHRRRIIAFVLAFALLTAACGNGDDDTSTSPAADGGLNAVIASYDLVAGRTGRFLVGLFGSDRTQLVAFGTVTFRFAQVDTGAASETDTAAEQDEPGELGEPIEASFLPIPGQDLDPDQPGPRLVGGAEATGVYGAYDVTFDEPGIWEVAVTASIGGSERTATAAFEVLADSAIPAVGDPAPRTTQALAGNSDVGPKSIDSRASTDRPIPDPELHDLTIADALDAGRPFLVVVSTPTFCVSRFCGPITDSVQELAQLFADTEMAFIHLEVWQDFETNTLNPGAREWIVPTPDTGGAEPWVFVVDADGIITHRFDNVATDAELLAAVEETLGLP